MVRVCSYVGCNNKEKSAVGLRMHIVPSRPEARVRWLTACSMSPNEPKSAIFVCSKHFIGGEGPTADHPDPVPCETLTPSRADALDALMALSESIIPAPCPPIVHSTPCKDDRLNTSNSCSNVESNETEPREFYRVTSAEEAALALKSVMSFIDSVQHKSSRGHFEELKSVLTFLNGLHLKDSPGLSLGTSYNTRRCLTLDELDNNSEHLDGTMDMEFLPLMPETPPNTRSNQILGETFKVPETSPASTTCEKKSIGIQCVRAPLSFHHCYHQSSTEMFHFYTGVTQANFEILYQFFGGDLVCSRLKYYSYNAPTPQKSIKSFLEPRDRLFITLVRLRRGVPLRDLSYLFGVALGTVSAIVSTWIRFMSLQCRRVEKEMFVTTEAQNLSNNNPLFEKFPNLRIIIDCTEFKIQRPYDFQMQSNIYSEYKSTNTIKYLIGCARSGAISYVSRGFEGSMSDKQIVIQSGILKDLKENDAVMADRGFSIEAELNELNVHLYLPPFLGKRKSLTAREEISTKELTSVRSYIEICNARVKNFRILRFVLPNKLVPLLDDMVFIAAFLSNLDVEFVPRPESD